MRLIALAMATLLGTSCAYVANPSAEHVLTDILRPPYSGDVKVSMEGAELTSEYDEVAIVTATGWSSGATLESVIAALQDEARKVGGNALIRVRYDRGAYNATATGVAVWIW
jgi:hypothetical protein